jgi:hypothetical protein
MNAPMMRQIMSWVPIAPLPSASHSALPAAPLIFAWDRLRENDVLLRKGGRPTHGKVRYFRFLQERAGEYASYKSPIDRRLLARELVDSWLRQGGRFCSTVDHGIGGGGRGAPTTPANPHRAGEVSSVFRVASTEEALQFTRLESTSMIFRHLLLKQQSWQGMVEQGCPARLVPTDDGNLSFANQLVTDVKRFFRGRLPLCVTYRH